MIDTRSLYLRVALTDQFWPIADGRGQATGMYVVKLLGVSPFSLDIVNLEPDVRRYPVIVNTLAPPLDLNYFRHTSEVEWRSDRFQESVERKSAFSSLGTMPVIGQFNYAT